MGLVANVIDFTLLQMCSNSGLDPRILRVLSIECDSSERVAFNRSQYMNYPCKFWRNNRRNKSSSIHCKQTSSMFLDDRKYDHGALH